MWPELPIQSFHNTINDSTGPLVSEKDHSSYSFLVRTDDKNLSFFGKLKKVAILSKLVHLDPQRVDSD